MARTLSLLQRRTEDAVIALLYLNDESFNAEGQSTLQRAWYWQQPKGNRLYLTDGYTEFARIERKSGVWRATLLVEMEA